VATRDGVAMMTLYVSLTSSYHEFAVSSPFCLSQRIRPTIRRAIVPRLRDRPRLRRVALVVPQLSKEPSASITGHLNHPFHSRPTRSVYHPWPPTQGWSRCSSSLSGASAPAAFMAPTWQTIRMRHEWHSKRGARRRREERVSSCTCVGQLC
jgi:hypothetical protein